MKEKSNENNEIQLSLSINVLIHRQNNDTFYSNMLKSINDNKVFSDQYFISNNGLLYKVMREIGK